MIKEMNYLVPEAQLFRLLAICSNANHCTKNHNKHCECRNSIKNIEDKLNSSSPSEDSGIIP